MQYKEAILHLNQVVLYKNMKYSSFVDYILCAVIIRRNHENTLSYFKNSDSVIITSLDRVIQKED